MFELSRVEATARIGVPFHDDVHLARKSSTTQLEQDLEAGTLKGGVEDSAVVSRVLEVYLKPMQETMLKVAPVMQLAGREARERSRLLPSIMQVRA